MQVWAPEGPADSWEARHAQMGSRLGDGEDGVEEVGVHGDDLLLHLDRQLEVGGDVVLLDAGKQGNKVQLAGGDVLALHHGVLAVDGPHVRPQAGVGGEAPGAGQDRALSGGLASRVALVVGLTVLL